MARASTYTWLSLDRFAQIMGANPLHFNGVFTNLQPIRSGCDDMWLQYDWQDAQHVSRESLAEAIQDAEQQIANFVGYNLLPDWQIDERHNTEPVGDPTLLSSGLNIQGRYKTIRTDKAHVISGGQRTKTAIQAGAAIVRSDADGDGYNELCTITVATTVTDANEIRVYYPGENGADAWEIRPLNSVVISGGNATITFKIWQAVLPDLLEALDATGIDGDTAANFLTTADVYRVWNNPQTQVQFLWEPFPACTCDTGTCEACQHGTQYGCLIARDYRLGRFAYSPATYADGAFTNTWFSYNRDPDQMRLWYFSGHQDKSQARPWQQLDPYWEKAIAYFAVALLDREICECEPFIVFWQNWQRDLSKNDATSFTKSFRDLDNEFGSWQGAIYAWRRANQEGRRIPR